MRGRRSRLALVLLGDRLVAAWLRKEHTETFIVEAEQPSAALRAELDARRIDARAVALGLSRASVSVKPIDLPSIAGEIREMVRFELDRHLPFPADDAAFDFLPLPAPAGTGNPAGAAAAHVLVLAADRRVVDSALRIATEARLRPRSLTVAAHNLLALVRPSLPERVVWLHRTGEATDLLFLVGARLVLSRRVPSAEDAVVADEIRSSLPVVRWPAPDALWISGDVAPPRAPSASPLTDLGAPVTEPPYTVAARRRLAGVPHDTRGAAQLAIAVASARRIRPLELIPPGLRPRRVTRGQTVTLAVLAATVVLSLGALFLPGYLEQRRLDAVNQSIKNLDAEVRTVDRIVRDLEQKRKLAATLESLPSSAIRPLPVLRELTDLLPADAWLTTLSLENKGVEMTGQAAAASTLIPLLENSPRFQRVEFASPVTRGRDKEQFRIQAGWETPPGSLVAAAIAAPPAPPPGPSPRATVPPSASTNSPSALAPGMPSSRSTDTLPPGELPAPRRPGAAPSRPAELGR